MSDLISGLKTKDSSENSKGENRKLKKEFALKKDGGCQGIRFRTRMPDIDVLSLTLYVCGSCE